MPWAFAGRILVLHTYRALLSCAQFTAAPQGSQDTGAGVARATTGIFYLGWRGRGAGMSCDPSDRVTSTPGSLMFTHSTLPESDVSTPDTEVRHFKFCHLRDEGHAPYTLMTLRHKSRGLAVFVLRKSRFSTRDRGFPLFDRSLLGFGLNDWCG
eukprot:gene13117-biopygen5000